MTNAQILFVVCVWVLSLLICISIDDDDHLPPPDALDA